MAHVVRGTAIAADVSRQSWKPVAVTHYYDIDKICRDCHRRFIFFAEEQKHWYEELGFQIDADAVRCPPCRKRDQLIAAIREKYERLFHVANRTRDESLEMVDCCLTLMEEAIFHPRQSERVRMLLKQVPAENQSGQRFLQLTDRLHAVEARWKAEKAAAPGGRPNEPPDKAGRGVA
jgi:hypothetical protein